MLVQAYIKGNDTVAVIDSDMCKIFDRSGRILNDNAPLTPDIVMGRDVYKAISVLSSSTEVEIALFDEAEVRKYKGDSNTVFSLMSVGGFIRRIQTKGVSNGIKYTQMIFLYSCDKDLEEIMRKVVNR